MDKISGIKEFNAEALLQLYRAELLNNVIPFWLRYAMDWKNGGICTCISDQGEILSYDKYMWSQLRAIYTFSALYNKIEKKQEWLDAALNIYEFVRKYGRDEQSRWLYCVSKDGKPLQGATSIYADGFAIGAFLELSKAVPDKKIINLATETYGNAQKQLLHPGSYRTDPLPIPKGAKAHGISMIFAHFFYDLGEYLNNPEIKKAGLDHAEQVMTDFLSPDRHLLYEFVKEDKSLLEYPPGKTVVPGHVLESMWFMIHIYRREGNTCYVRQAIECIKWHIELGWDSRYGGIVLAKNAKGSFWEDKEDTKLWWVHTEALYALLLAYYTTQEDWCLDWFIKVHNYAFSHYPVTGYGEWLQRLDRYGNSIKNIADLPVKDPYHLARALINCIQLIENHL